MYHAHLAANETIQPTVFNIPFLKFMLNFKRGKNICILSFYNQPGFFKILYWGLT